MSLGFPSYTCHRELPAWVLNESQYRINLPPGLGKYRIGGLIILSFMVSKACCCSSGQTKDLPFFVRSYIGFNNFCRCLQKMLRQLTTPQKLLHPLTLVGGCSFCIASILDWRGVMEITEPFMWNTFPMYVRCFMNNWHFLGDSFSPCFIRALNRASSLSK